MAALAAAAVELVRGGGDKVSAWAVVAAVRIEEPAVVERGGGLWRWQPETINDREPTPKKHWRLND